MRYAHASVDRWSQNDIGSHERDELARQIVAMAATLGFDIPDGSISGTSLKDRADAIVISLEGEGTAGRHGRHYIPYPMEDRVDQSAPVVLRDFVVHDLFRHLHTQRWRQERRRAVSRLSGPALQQHLDADAITRWCLALSRNHPERIGNLDTKPSVVHEFGHSCNARLKTSIGTIAIDVDTITLPHHLPHALGGTRLRPLGEIMALPACGDEALDAEVAAIYVHEIEPDVKRPGRASVSTLRLGYQFQKPLVGKGDSSWRRLREVRPSITGIPPGYLAPDLVGAARDYHAACDAALGTPTTLPVPLEMTGEAPE